MKTSNATRCAWVGPRLRYPSGFVLLAQGGSLMALTLEFFSHDSGDML